MKQLVIIFFLALVVNQVFAEEANFAGAQVEFSKGNEAYKEGNYEKALEYFLNAEEHSQGFAINYNLANTYFKLNLIPESILHYERALKYDPANEDVIYNLRLANDLIVDRIENLPKSKLNRWWRAFRFGMGPDGWGWVALALAIFSALGGFLFFYSNHGGFKRLGFFGGILLFIFMILAITLAQSAHNFRDTKTSAVVFTDKVDVKSEPRSESINVFVLHAGTKVELIQEQDEWVEIEIGSGSRGWLEAKELEEI
jgi:tetratricopeptide (TPR) repeat protein